MRIDLKANETVVKATNTLHSSGTTEYKGKLVLTNQRIYFISAQREAEAYDFEILPGQISEVVYYNAFRFFPKGLELKTKEGNSLKFTMKDRDTWCRMIVSMN